MRKRNDSPLDLATAARLQRLHDQHGWSWNRMAEVIGISTPTLTTITRRPERATPDTCWLVRRWLNNVDPQVSKPRVKKPRRQEVNAD